MRNLSSAPALLAAALATTTLEGCSALNPLSYAEDAYDWLTGDDSTAAAKVHYAKTDNPTYPGDFSVDGELEKARTAALKYAEVPIIVDEPWYNPFSNDHPGIAVDTSEFADQCFKMSNDIDSPASAGEDKTPEGAAEKQAELAQKLEKDSRLTHFQKVQDLAGAALKSATFATLWPAYQAYQTDLGPIPANLADKVATYSEEKKIGISKDNVLCPEQKDYLLDGDKRVPVVAFKVDDTRIALPPDFWSGTLNDCDRAGILAAMQYDGGREFSTFPETNGRGTETTNLLQATVTGLCKNPNATVTGASRYLDSYYGWENGDYTIDSAGNILTSGTAKVNGLSVNGRFWARSGNPKKCPIGAATLTLDSNTTLLLNFTDDGYPHEKSDATLKKWKPEEEGKAREIESETYLTADWKNAPGDKYAWYVCHKDDDTNCLKWTEYTLDATTYGWASKEEKGTKAL